MDPKDMNDPAQPAARGSSRAEAAERQAPGSRAARRRMATGDEPYGVDPQEEPAHAPDEERTGAIADRARGERALFDREDADPDADLARDDAEEPLTGDAPPTSDEVEVRRRNRGKR